MTSTSAAVCGVAQLGGPGARTVAVAVGDRHPAAVGGKGARARPADPGRPADDDGDPLATVAHPVGLSTASRTRSNFTLAGRKCNSRAWQTRLVTELKLSDSISVAVTPDELYALVSDVTRMGEWSPICRACWWDEGAGPQVGAWFTGRNETPERTLGDTKSGGGRRSRSGFAWEVNHGWVYWGYTFEPEGGGTRLTESWEFLPAGIAGFRERYGADADAEIEKRHDAARSGIPATSPRSRKPPKRRRQARAGARHPEDLDVPRQAP